MQLLMLVLIARMVALPSARGQAPGGPGESNSVVIDFEDLQEGDYIDKDHYLFTSKGPPEDFALHLPWPARRRRP